MEHVLEMFFFFFGMNIGNVFISPISINIGDAKKLYYYF